MYLRPYARFTRGGQNSFLGYEPNNFFSLLEQETCRAPGILYMTSISFL